MEVRNEDRDSRIRRLKRSCILRCIGICGVLVILFTCVFGITTAKTDDMFPAIRPGDILVFLRIGTPGMNAPVIYRTDGPEEDERTALQDRAKGTAGEVDNIGKEDEQTAEAEGLTGRVMACAGMEIGRTEDGLVTIRGNIQPVRQDAGLFWKTHANAGMDEEAEVEREADESGYGTGGLEYPSVCPEGTFFVLGDRRDTARDSRVLGFIPRENIKGKIITVIRRRAI